MGFAFHYVNMALYIHIKSSDFFPVLIFCILPPPHLSSLSRLFAFIHPLLSFDSFIQQMCVRPLLCAQRCAAHQLGCSPCLRGVLNLDRETGSLLHVARACRRDGPGRKKQKRGLSSRRRALPFRWPRGTESARCAVRQVLADRLFHAQCQYPVYVSPSLLVHPHTVPSGVHTFALHV